MATVGELYGPAMKITDQTEADEYFETLVVEMMGREKGRSRETAEKIVRSNLGYYSGYYDGETMDRVRRLYSCKHPVFG